MTPQERELLTGMGNCHDACGEDFEGTVRMVAHARDLEPEAVKRTLARLRDQYSQAPEYQALRGRLPNDFPM